MYSNRVYKCILNTIADCHEKSGHTRLTVDENFLIEELDSMSFIQLVVAVEKEFNIEFDDDKLLISEFIDVKSMVEYVESKIS